MATFHETFYTVTINGPLQQQQNPIPEDHWSCIAHLIAEDMLKSAIIEEKKFNKNTQSPWVKHFV